jgi:hypothetical protein
MTVSISALAISRTNLSARGRMKNRHDAHTSSKSPAAPMAQAQMLMQVRP